MHAPPAFNSSQMTLPWFPLLGGWWEGLPSPAFPWASVRLVPHGLGAAPSPPGLALPVRGQQGASQVLQPQRGGLGRLPGPPRGPAGSIWG